ncbi:MAG: hypothetical protein ACPL7L_05825, partial [bacterium]
MGPAKEDISGAILVADNDVVGRGDVGNGQDRLPVLEILLSERGESGYRVKFSESPFLSPFLRGREIWCHDSAPAPRPLPEGDVLAHVNGHPMWVTKLERGARRDTVLQCKEWYEKEDRLFEHLKGRTFFRLVPVIEWLRYVSGWSSWEKPPIMACIMFDDPNLHSTRYGFISFKELQRNAKVNNFSVALATIPIDAWFARKDAADLVKGSDGRLSLLFHGMYHSMRELADDDEKVLSGRARDALASIERLERKFGLKVSRVMAPPHGAFGLRAMKCLASLGFDAACVSWG